MYDNFDNLVDTLVELKISANQFLLCYLLLTDEKENGKYVANKKAMVNVYKYAYAVKWSKSDIEDLVTKGYLKSYNKLNSFEADLMVVTNKFKEDFFASQDRFSQLVSLYPKTLPNFSGTGYWKTMATDIDALEEYYNRIVRLKSTHESIIELTQWAVDNNQINTNFENYVKGRCWDAIKELKDKYTVSDNMKVAK